MEKELVRLLEGTFVEGKLYEVVVTTVRDRGKGAPNASAMGIAREGMAFNMRSYKGSDTFNNLRALKRLGINIVTADQVDFLARAALIGWGTEEAEFAPEEYENMRGFPFLKAAIIQLDCKVEDWTENYGQDDFGDYHIATFQAVPDAFKAKTACTPVERGTSAVLEALVFATRWKVAEGELKEFLWERLKAYMDKAHQQGGPANLKALDLLDKFVI